MKELLLKSLLFSFMVFMLLSCASPPSSGSGRGTSCPEIVYEITREELIRVLRNNGHDAYRHGERSIQVNWRRRNIKFSMIVSESGRLIRSHTFFGKSQLTALSLASVNEWNKKYMLGKVYIDKDGDLAVELVLDMTKGVTIDRLLDFIDDFPSVVLRVVVEHFSD